MHCTFKIGDKVVFMTNIMMGDKFKYLLKEHYIYTVSKVVRINHRDEIIVEGYPTISFDATRFISLLEFRRERIIKIKKGIKS